jgi:hypothetical protein
VIGSFETEGLVIADLIIGFLTADFVTAGLIIGFVTGTLTTTGLLTTGGFATGALVLNIHQIIEIALKSMKKTYRVTDPLLDTRRLTTSVRLGTAVGPVIEVLTLQF